MKSGQDNASLMWPGVLAAALVAMLAFMIVADPAADRPATSVANTTKQ